MTIDRKTLYASITEDLHTVLEGMRLSYGMKAENIVADYTLLHRLVSLGPSHCKGLRMIHVLLEIKAPLFWWSEFDTYKVGTTALSESTMHTLTKRPLTQEDFEYPIPDTLLDTLNDIIKEKGLVTVKNLLPHGFLQKRIVSVNYQVLRTMYWQRKDHRLPQWRQFCDFLVYSLPYASLIIEPDARKA